MLECVCEHMQGQGMRDAEMLVWAGDFNYRIEATYEDALDHIRNNDLDYLIDRVSTPLPPPSPRKMPLLTLCSLMIAVNGQQSVHVCVSHACCDIRP